VSVPERQTLFGLEIDALTMAAVVDRARLATRQKSRMLIGVVNAAKIVQMRADPRLRASLLAADLLLADGQSVIWASRLLGRPLPERVAGIDLFERLLEAADEEHLAVYFLGARTEVLDKLLATVRDRYPSLVIAGGRNGYFSEDAAPGVAAVIADSHADMLFLGMPSPIKENFLAGHADSMGVPLLHGVGGSFDVLAGITRRAPQAWQRHGFEWAFRLLQEPGRLWNRYLTSNTAFIVLTIRERFRPTPSYAAGHAPAGDHRRTNGTDHG
jgi:N-acetylglucosaminyldiphosphoundecaprenol N-acetyl-beta-D-mannosaminyltransferase